MIVSKKKPTKSEKASDAGQSHLQSHSVTQYTGTFTEISGSSKSANSGSVIVIGSGTIFLRFPLEKFSTKFFLK